MALYFKDRRRWPPSRPVQFVLAFLALILAVAVLVAWLIVGYHQSVPTPTEEPDSTSTSEPEIITDVGRCLVILDMDTTQHFVLIQTNPATPQISVMHIPGNLKAEDATLKEVFKKNGSPRAMQTVSEALDIPLSHYLTLNGKGLENFINQFENGIVYTLPEKIGYTDENDIHIQLAAKEHTLTGGQVKEVLRYNQWDKSSNQNKVTTDLICALFNQYLNSDFPLKAYFGLLSNDAVTDLRIDNFNSYHGALTQIAQGNTGKICQAIKIKGATKDGKFTPDIPELKKTSPFYE